MTLSAIGEAETPAGGSVCIRWEHLVTPVPEKNIIGTVEEGSGRRGGRRREDVRTLKSRIRRRLAEVDMVAVKRTSREKVSIDSGYRIAGLWIL